jgi:hypothetical protein
MEVPMQPTPPVIGTEFAETHKAAQARRGDSSAPASTPGPVGRPLPTDPDALLFPAEAAYLLALSARTLEGLRLRGGGPVPVRFGRAVRYRRADVVAWIQARRFDSTSGVDQTPREIAAHGPATGVCRASTSG